MLAAPLALVLALADAPPTVPTDITLAGVVVGTTPDRSSAILVAGGRTRVVAVGEAAFGGRLVAVARDSVTLEFGGARRELRLPAAAPAPPPAPARAPAVSPALTPGAPPEDPQTPAREMSRVEVQRRLGEEIPRILAETAIAPVMEEGHVVGVQITRLPEGTLLGDAGLRTGDVLTRINGTDIDGMATLIGLWPRLQSATELRATVLRSGQPFSLVVSLR